MWFNIDAPTGNFAGVKLAGADGQDGSQNTRPRLPDPRPPSPVAGGDFGNDKVLLIAITEQEFVEKWNAPRISRLEPFRARVGAPVKLIGENFSSTDRVFLRSQDSPRRSIDLFAEVSGVQFRNHTQLEFQVPDIAGGTVEIEVRPAVGPSFSIDMMVLPAILRVEPEGRLAPGTRATIKGTGFSPSCRVFLAESEGNTAPKFVDKNTITFTVYRGDGNVRDEERDGEVRRLSVSHGLANTMSNEFQVILDTFRIVVLGDSVLWGQGLPQDQGEPTKIHELVAVGLAMRFSKSDNKIGIHVKNLAHSGAIIGIAEDGSGRELGNDRTDHAPDGRPSDNVGLRQEVNTSYPTILQQAERDFEGRSDTVDLVILDGGINDVNVRKILPSIDDNDLKRRIRIHCRDNMETLLLRVTRKFPSATVVVLGSYPIISLATDLGEIPGYLMRIGVATAVTAAFTQYFAGSVAVAASMDKATRAQLAHNCRLFYEESEMAFQQAIDSVNADIFPTSRAGARRVFLAAPEFEDADAVFAPKAKLFGLNPGGGPEDNSTVRDPRIVACDAYYKGDPIGGEICHRASAGHPNEDGAKMFAAEILATLDMNSVFSPATFKPGFLWGAATAAFQVEGRITNNDWHHFTDSQKIRDRVTALGKKANLDVAMQNAEEGVGHYDLATVQKELDRMKALGMNAYRFSIEWSRVEPTEGAAESSSAVQSALGYYDAVLSAILERQMTPVVTLNHLTLPEWILRPPQDSWLTGLASDQDPDYVASKQGWMTTATVDAYVRFVRRMAIRYADKVEFWVTLNEPVASMIGIGYLGGLWSPGFSLDGSKAKTVYFNLLRAHVRAYDAIKQEYKAVNRPSSIGIAHAMMFAKLPPPEPGIDSLDNFSSEDIAKARDQFNYYFNWHFLDSLIEPEIRESLEISNTTRISSDTFFGRPFCRRLDFLGINYYRSIYLDDGLLAQRNNAAITAASAGFMGGTFEQNLANTNEPHHLLNDLTWEMYPRGLYAIIKQASERYDNPLPILITENGVPEAADRNRAAYTVSHVQQLLRASLERVPILGYLHWSIVDNFEWFEHYNATARFGLFTVDRTSGNGDGPNFDRHITEGALALQYLIAENGIGRAVERFGKCTQKATPFRRRCSRPASPGRGLSPLLRFQVRSHFTSPAGPTARISG